MSLVLTLGAEGDDVEQVKNDALQVAAHRSSASRR